MNRVPDKTVKKVDNLIRQHLSEAADTVQDGLPVAAVSTSDRFSWAKDAGVEVEFIDERLETICREVPADEFSVVPRFRLKQA